MLLLLTQPGPVFGQTDEEIEHVFWQSVECKSKRQVQADLEVYPTGRYLAEAWACLEGQLGLERAERILVQRGLAALDYSAGVADGLFGPATRRAVRAWQEAKEFAATGYLTREQADALIAQGREVATAQQQREKARRQRLAQEAKAQRQKESATRAESRQVGETFKDCPACPQMIVVPAGSFLMGSPAHEAGRYDDEGPVHQVVIEQPFAVGVYEVTRKEFGRFVAETERQMEERCRIHQDGERSWRAGFTWRAPGFSQTERHPVVCVNWEDAQAYVEWRAGQTDKAYRLLSEAEWEYVARAGTMTTYSWGDTIGRNQANCDGCGSQWDNRQTAPVGSFAANGWGLHDIHGNVWEWVADCWNKHYRGAPTDGGAWMHGDCGQRVWRGGSWDSSPKLLRSAIRSTDSISYRSYGLGFRIARSLD